mgnify:CR=1 FL=1
MDAINAIAPEPSAAAGNGPAVHLDGVTVVYGDNRALKDVSATFRGGAVGLLGPNGAGKSTMLKSLLGFITPTAGRMTVLGLDVATRPLEIRARLGYMPESDAHIPGMNAVSFVAYCGQLAGLPAVDAMQRAHEVLYYVGLGEARYRNVETYSTGMRQRIKLAQALVHGPKLLLLDEPTNGLDPKGRVEMLELIRSISHGKGVNVIVSSHLLPDIERTCDQVIVLMRGKLRAQGFIKDLKRIAGQPVDVELLEKSDSFVAAVQARGGEVIQQEGYSYRFSVPGEPEAQGILILQAARESGVQVRGFGPAVRSLEDAFLEAVHG